MNSCAEKRRGAMAAGKRPRTENIKFEVGERLRWARELLDENRTRFSARYDVDHTLWSRWEKGLHYPDPAKMVALCDEFGLTMDYFYRGILAHMPNEPSSLHWRRSIRNLCAAQRGNQPSRAHQTMATPSLRGPWTAYAVVGARGVAGGA
jgi:transcriptional regulator with XRE-family HTH domain